MSYLTRGNACPYYGSGVAKRLADVYKGQPGITLLLLKYCRIYSLCSEITAGRDTRPRTRCCISKT